MKKNQLAAALLAAMLVLSLTACQEDTSDKKTDSASPTSAREFITQPETTVDNEALDQELYNLYVSINNHMLGRLYDSLNRYFSYIAYQEEFALVDADDPDYYCYSISDSQMDNIEDAYDLASSKAEPSALDQSFLALYPSIKEIISTLNSIYDYTDMKSYLDDDYARGKEYHSTLWNAMQEYDIAGGTFMDELDIVAKERNAASLLRLKDEGFEVLYTINVMFNNAEAIQEELYNQGISDENLLEMDLTAIQPLYDEFVANVEAILEYANDEDKLQSEGIPVNSAYWHTFIDSMKDTKTSLTEVLQRVKDQKPYSYYNEMIMSLPGEDSILSFNAGISAMIDDYNIFIHY